MWRDWWLVTHKTPAFARQNAIRSGRSLTIPEMHNTPSLSEMKRDTNSIRDQAIRTGESGGWLHFSFPMGISSPLSKVPSLSIVVTISDRGISGGSAVLQDCVNWESHLDGQCPCPLMTMCALLLDQIETRGYGRPAAQRVKRRLGNTTRISAMQHRRKHIGGTAESSMI
jgi:hypothetical protein